MIHSAIRSMFLKTLSLATISLVLTASALSEAAPHDAQKKARPASAPVDPIQTRPSIAGDFIGPAKLQNYAGETVELASLLKDKYTVLVYSNREDLALAKKIGYFEILSRPLTDLGYKFVFVCPTKDVTVPTGTPSSDVSLLVDESHRSFESLGLADTANKQAPTRSGVFLVDPKMKILFAFSSSSKSVPLSSEVLILAARVYRDYSKKELALETPR